MQERAKAFKGGEPYTQVGQIASKSIAQNVERGGRPKWRKRKGSYSHPILDKTGSMRDSGEDTATHWTQSGNVHTNEIKGPDYGLIHQYTGVKTKTGNKIENVVRKYVNFQKSEINAMTKAFRDAFLVK